MATPYVGEIRLVGFNFAPQGWLLCQGQLVSIADYETLFTLIGTTYGGDGQTTFAMPDLQSRVPIHQGTDGTGHSYLLGQSGGQESVILTAQQLAGHVHPISANNTGSSSPVPTGGVFAVSAENAYESASNGTSAPLLTSGGGSQPHDNLMPYLAMNYIISPFGIFPSQN